MTIVYKSSTYLHFWNLTKPIQKFKLSHWLKKTITKINFWYGPFRQGETINVWAYISKDFIANLLHSVLKSKLRQLEEKYNFEILSFYTSYRVLHIYWPGLNDSPFLNQLTQEIVMHFFRKPWILAVKNNYERLQTSFVNLVGFCFPHWNLITRHF